MSEKPLIVIVMGSKRDVEHCQKIADAAMKHFGIESVMRVASAHRTPDHAVSILRAYEADPRPKVYVTVAGRSNALSGFSDGVVAAPVIACPPYSDSFGGGDIFSTIRMPAGVAPATILEPENAAVYAAKTFGLFDAEIRAKVKAYQAARAQTILDDDASLN